ncbi:MAG: hypothetical protein DHS20C18_34920 [Saprospiraceae bacterium]|nr:MAG: hypothetical protein DHS20C18_34920 [Saprospiraceae bacterium]
MILTPQTILTIGGNAKAYFQLNRWLPRYRVIPLLASQPGEGKDYDPGLVLLFNPPDSKQLSKLLTEVHHQYPEVPIIVLQTTNAAPIDKIVDTFRCGVQTYLDWPCDKVVLQEKIAAYFQNSSKWRVLYNYWSQKLWKKPAKGQISQMESVSNNDTSKPGMSFFFNHVPHLETPDLQVNFFGNFSMKTNKSPLPEIRSRLKNALLSYLLYHREEYLHREKLMELFWPHVSPDSSRNSLNVAISQIRQYLRPHLPVDDFLLFRNEGYIIQPDLEILTDVEQFIQLCDKGSAALQSGKPEAVCNYLKQAKGIYQYDFMANLPYEEWCTNERDALKEKYLSILHGLAQYYYHKNDFAHARPVAEQILEKDPFLEDTHRLLMDCYAQLNQRGKALQQYGKCQQLLKEYFQVEPSQATRVLMERIRG